MSGEITLGSVGSNIKGFFSGITRESVGQFCTEKRDYVVSIARNIPGFMQESPTHAVGVLFVANALALAILDYALLSRIERRMETTSAADQDRVITKKKWLNLFGVGALFYGLNVGLAHLHKYELSRTHLLLIAAVIASYRLFKLTMPQVVPPAAPNAEKLARQELGEAAIHSIAADRAAQTAQQAAEDAEQERANAEANLPQGLLDAQDNLERLLQEYQLASEPQEIQDCLTAKQPMDELQERVTAAEREIGEINDASTERHAELTAQLEGTPEDQANGTPAVVGLRDRLEVARQAYAAARLAAGAEQNGDVREGSLLAVYIAARTAYHDARQLTTANQEALTAYNLRAETARTTLAEAQRLRQEADAAYQAAQALLPPVAPPQPGA